MFRSEDLYILAFHEVSKFKVIYHPDYINII